MTAPGRYCLPLPGTCYCGDCDHYRPLPDARTAPTESATAPKSWDKREESTWIDKL